MAAPSAADLDALLPQTQCRRCGYEGCRPYAEAIVAHGAAINRCPPGGTATIELLALATQRPSLPLDPDCGSAAQPRVAVVDEARCIGCARCLPPCPVDAIVGAARMMHTVVAALCNGCELCIPACPVDCIAMQPRDTARAGAEPTAAENRVRFERHESRRAADAARNAQLLDAHKRAARQGPPAASGGRATPT
jgi:electron transport complex protein RnfB